MIATRREKCHSRPVMEGKTNASALLALTMLVAATTSGFASLWDTFDECVAKYGKPIHVSDATIAIGGEPAPNRFTFKRNDLLIFVWLSDKRRSIREDFMSLNGRLEMRPLTDDQIAAILRENAGGSSWSIWQIRHVSPDTETPGVYRRADGHGLAMVTGNAISIDTGQVEKEFEKQVDEIFKKRSQESEKTNKP
jgi:hypothetical protein